MTITVNSNFIPSTMTAEQVDSFQKILTAHPEIYSVLSKAVRCKSMSHRCDILHDGLHEKHPELLDFIRTVHHLDEQFIRIEELFLLRNIKVMRELTVELNERARHLVTLREFLNKSAVQLKQNPLLA